MNYTLSTFIADTGSSPRGALWAEAFSTCQLGKSEAPCREHDRGAARLEIGKRAADLVSVVEGHDRMRASRNALVGGDAHGKARRCRNRRNPHRATVATIGGRAARSNAILLNAPTARGRVTRGRSIERGADGGPKLIDRKPKGIRCQRAVGALLKASSASRSPFPKAPVHSKENLGNRVTTVARNGC